MAQMIKPWSIPADCFPDRLRGCLGVLAEWDGKRWDESAQEAFQIRLIQALFFPDQLSSREDFPNISSGKGISRQRAAEIYAAKNYKHPARRVRRLVQPLIAFGFLSLENGTVRITKMGEMFLAETKDYEKVFLRCLLKWEIPNPLETEFAPRHGYNIQPFIGAMRLIAAVNRLCAKTEKKGVSFSEFGIFALTLIDWREINKTAQEIISFRRRLLNIPAERRDNFIADACGQLRPQFDLRRRNIHTQNAFNYFRITKYVAFRECNDATYIDLSEARNVELDSLFEQRDARPLFYTPAAAQNILHGYC